MLRTCITSAAGIACRTFSDSNDRNGDHRRSAQGSPEARQACTPDAMRLCSEFTSDVSLTTKSMMAKRAQWSPECRAAMAHGTSHRAYRHYYRHYRHCTHGYCG